MIVDIENHTPTNSDKYLIDTNILLLVYCPIASHRPDAQKQYSSYLSKLRAAKSELYVTSQVLSEFINTYFRLDFKLFQNKTAGRLDYKKDYRNSTDFKTTHSAMIPILQSQILKMCQKLDDEFSSIDLDSVLKNIALIDHNDAYYAELIQRKRLHILTDDGDYAIYKDKFDIYTANTKLLKI